MFEGFVPWPVSDIGRLRNLIDMDIPSEFAGLLAEVGSGSFKDGMRVVPGSTGNGLLGGIDDFDTMVTSRTWSGGYSSIVPSEYLAIGSGAGGELCVGLDDCAKGVVFWFDYDRAEEVGLYDSPPVGDVRDVIAKLFVSWTEFLGDVHRWPVV